MRDKLDWHATSAVDNGQPEEHGFVHIACFLHWLGLRRWLEPRLFSKADRTRIADGSISLADLIDLTDEQLTSDMATSEGADFGMARYDAYLDLWTNEFADVPTYAVPWTAATRARAVAILDELRATWDVEGRPRPIPADRGLWKVHIHPEVEHLIPGIVAGVELKVDSFAADAFGDVSRDELLVAGVDAREAAYVLAQDGRSGRSSMQVALLVVPSMSAAEMERLLGGHRWPIVARSRPERHNDIGLTTGLIGDSLVALWYRDGVAAKVWARTRSALLSAVRDIDAMLHEPIQVRSADGGPRWNSDDEPRELPHVTPELEALLPDEVMAVPTVRSSEPLGPFREHRVPLSRIGVDPTLAYRAIAHGPEQTRLELISVPGVPAEILGSIAVELASFTPEVPFTTAQVGDRHVRWQKNAGWTTAIWTRDGLICSVQGGASKRLILEAIEQMP